MKNKLTLKSLKQELENMKLKNVKSNKLIDDNPTTGHNIKNSYINSLYSKSSGLLFYLVTAVIAYGHKIPFIGRIISLVGLYYGRTTIWKVLAKLRKIFIIVNALIGVYMVFKTAGFSSDNIIAGWLAVGETYFETLAGLTGRLFRWFVELFDHKVVPNVPGDNGGTWFSKPKVIENKSIFVPSNLNISDIIENKPFSLRALYKDGVISNTSSWYTDKTTWYWIAGTVFTLGFLYFGYKFVTDPLYIFDRTNPSIKTTGPTPPTDNVAGLSDYSLPPSPPITIGRGVDHIVENVTGAASSVTKGFVNTYRATTRALNPFNWFPVAADVQSKLNDFLDVQFDMVRSDRRLYPFTENNPYDGWLTKLRKAYIGESNQEFIERTRLAFNADRIYESLKVSKGKMVDMGGLTPIWSGHTTPGYITPAASVGLHPSSSSYH